MTVADRLADLWRFREVVKNFVSQDLKVKYRRSALGFFWSLLNPLLHMLVISTVFSLIFKVPNFTLYVLAGLVPWTFFATSIEGCTTSIISAEALLRRQYFPKLVFPLSVVATNLVAFVLSLGVLLILLTPLIGFRPNAAWLILPLSFATIAAFALGCGAIAAALTVHFRDMQHLISVFIGALFYLTPIIYPLDPGGPANPRMAMMQKEQAAQAVTGDQDEKRDAGTQGRRGEGSSGDSNASTQAAAHAAPANDGGVIPFKYRFYFKLNPMYSMVEMFHRPIYHGMLPTPSELAAALGAAGAALAIGLGVFWRCENGLVFAL